MRDVPRRIICAQLVYTIACTLLHLIAFLLPLSALAAGGTGNDQEGVPIDLNSIRTEYYELTLSGSFGSGVKPGDGVDISNPFWPKPVAGSPFGKPATALQISTKLKPNTKFTIKNVESNDQIHLSTSFQDQLTIEEEATVLAGSFRASYMLNSAEAAFSKARFTRRTGKAVYFFYNFSGLSQKVNPNNVRWDDQALSAIDAMPNQLLRMQYFIQKYGSHYVLSVDYGARLAVRAELHTLDETKQSALSAAVNIGLGAFAAGGQISDEARAMLHSGDISIQAELTAGGVLPSTQKVVLISVDQVMQFLDDFRNNKITLVSGPIGCSAWTYWSTFDRNKTPNLFNDFSPSIREAAPSPFGVPQGTVVAWSPRAGDIESTSDGKRIIPPRGWLVCDGTQGTPNLIERFVIGTATPGKLLTTAGLATVTPTGKVGVSKNRDARDGNGWQGEGGECMLPSTSLSMDPINLIPPSTYLVYLMKQ